MYHHFLADLSVLTTRVANRDQAAANLTVAAEFAAYNASEASHFPSELLSRLRGIRPSNTYYENASYYAAFLEKLMCTRPPSFNVTF